MIGLTLHDLAKVAFAYLKSCHIYTDQLLYSCTATAETSRVVYSCTISYVAAESGICRDRTETITKLRVFAEERGLATRLGRDAGSHESMECCTRTSQP